MKRCFSLAEVLITIGIIGIVSALTIPTMLTNYQKRQTVTKLKHAYSVVNQAILLSVSENGEVEGWDSYDTIGVTEYFNRYWLPYFKNATVCKENINTCKYKNRYPSYYSSTFKYLNGEETLVTAIVPSSRNTLLLPNGTVLINFTNFSIESKSRKNQLFIDVNGALKPNIIGKDVFVFERNDKGLLIPACNNFLTDEINLNCSKAGLGECCTKRIMDSGWEITKDYPW